MTKTERMRDILEPIAHQLQSPQELDRVLATIASEAAERLKAEGCRIWLIRRGDVCQTCRWASGCSDQRRCLHLKASFGIGGDSAFRRAPLDVFANEIVARGGIADWSLESQGMRLLIDPSWAQERRIASFVVQPLRVENRVLGLMAIFSAHPLQEADFHRCAVFAASASTAIRVAELANRTQRAESAVQEKNREWRQTSRLFNAVLNSPTENAIVVEDLEGNILAFNEGARQMYGYTPEEVVGVANAERLYAPEDWTTGRVMEIFKTTLAQGMYEGVIRRARKNGEIFQEQATITIHRDEDGDPAGFVIVSREMTQRMLSAQSESADDPALRALETVMQVRRPERFPMEILKRFGALFQVQEGVLLLAEGDALAVRAAFGYPSSDALAGLRIASDEAPVLFKLLHSQQPQEVTDEILPPSSPLCTESRISEMSPRWVIPLFQAEPIGLVLLAPPPNIRYDDASLLLGLRFGKLAASIFDQFLLVEQTNAQLQYLQDNYATLYQQNRVAGEQISALERGLEQATKIAVRREAEYAEMMKRCGQLEQDSSELSTYALQLETALRSLKQRWAGLSGKFEGAASLATHIDELESVIAQLSDEKRKLASNLAEAQEHYELAHRRLSERNAQLERILAESQRELNDREIRFKALESQGADEFGGEAANVWRHESAELRLQKERLEREVAAAVEALREQEARAGRAELASSLAFEQRDAARQEADNMRRLLSEARRRLATAKSNFVRTDEMVSPLRAENSAAQRMTPAGLIEPTIDARAFSDLEKRYRRLTAEADILRTELLRVQSVAAHVRDMQVKCGRFEEVDQARLMQIQAFEATIEVLETERICLEAENQDITAQMHALRENVERLEGERATISSALSAIAHEADDARQRLQEMDAFASRMDAEKTVIEESAAQLEWELAQTRHAVSEKEEEVAKTWKERERIAAENDMLRETIAEHVREMQEYSQRQAARESFLSSLMHRLQALNEERAVWRLMLGQAEVDAATFREKAVADAQAMAELRQELENLHSARSYVETEIAAIQNRFDAIQDSYCESVSQMDARIENSIRANAELAAQLELAKRDVAEREELQLSLRARLEAMAYEKALSEERLDQATALAVENRRALDSLRATLSPSPFPLTADADEAFDPSALQGLLTRIAQLEQENAAWAAQYAEAESQWRMNFTSLDASMNTARTLNDILLKRAEIEKAELSSHVSKLQFALDAAQTELEAMRRESESSLQHPMADFDYELEVIRKCDPQVERDPHVEVGNKTVELDVELDLDPMKESVENAEENFHQPQDDAPLVLESPNFEENNFANEPRQKSFRAKRVAIASDRNEDRQSLASWLDVIGCYLSWAESGDEMLSILMTEKPDVLIVGLENPDFDSFELQRRMRRNPDWRKIPILLLLPEASGENGTADISDSGVRSLYYNQLTPESFQEALSALSS